MYECARDYVSGNLHIKEKWLDVETDKLHIENVSCLGLCKITGCKRRIKLHARFVIGITRSIRVL